MRLKSIVVGLVLAGSLASAAQAQVTVDVSKVTCDQFVHGQIGTPRTVAIWFSGYYHGKRDLRTYDPQAFEANMNRLENFCYQEQNFKMPLMQAVERVFGAGK